MRSSGALRGRWPATIQLVSFAAGAKRLDLVAFLLAASAGEAASLDSEHGWATGDIGPQMRPGTHVVGLVTLQGTVHGVAFLFGVGMVQVRNGA